MGCGRFPDLAMALPQEPVVGGLTGFAQAKDQVCFPFATLDRDGENVGREIVGTVGPGKDGKTLCDALVSGGVVWHQGDQSQ